MDDHCTRIPTYAPVAKEYPPILSEAQTAEMTSLSVEWYRLHRSLGDGPPFMRIGRSIRYSRDAVLEWFAAREVARP